MSPTTTAPSSASTTQFNADLATLLDGLDPAVSALARELAATVSHIRPDFVAQVRFGWRSVNFRHPKAGFVCAVFPYPDRVALIFEHGRLLADTAGLLEGDGNRVRFIRLHPGDAIPEAEIALFIAEAVALKS